MSKEFTVSQEVIHGMQLALAERKNWMAYDMQARHLEPCHSHFAWSKGQAISFAFENNSSANTYRVIHFKSVDEAINNITIKNVSIMNEKNLESLKGNLKYLGFGDKMNERLESNIREQMPEFSMRHMAEFNNRNLEATLHFKGGEQNEMYFFNKYDARLDDKQQTFYLDRGNGITIKESFNLLDGRAVNKDLVNKEGEKYNAWVQLDFENKEQNGNYRINRYHENYGYNLEATLHQYAIKELNDPKAKDDLIKSLEKGNLQSVRIEMEGKDERYFIQAEPRFKDIMITDKSGHMLTREQAGALKTSGGQEVSGKEVNNEQNQSEKKEQKNQPGGDDDESPMLTKKRTRKQGKGISA